MSAKDYQWYPGHMTKARRMMEEQVALVDVIIELVDARIVTSSSNPDLKKIGKNKKRLIILNKADLADEPQTRRWIAAFEKEGARALAVNALKSGEDKKIIAALKKCMEAEAKKDEKKGLTHEIRAMVAGIPNVGKSTLINCLAHRALTKTANKPGVTRGKQWITLDDHIRLLDTPGILWPKFEDEKTGEHLALIGSLNDVNLDMETLAVALVRALEEDYKELLPVFFGYTAEDVERVAEEETTGIKEAAILYLIAKKRGAVRKGGLPDYEKASGILLTEFRAGRLGRITLEKAEDT